MIQARYKHAAVTVGSLIYIIGGTDDYDHSKHLDTMEVFDPQTESFVLGPRMPFALTGMAAVVIGKYIIVIGGYDNSEKESDKTLLYDTELDHEV